MTKILVCTLTICVRASEGRKLVLDQRELLLGEPVPNVKRCELERKNGFFFSRVFCRTGQASILLFTLTVSRKTTNIGGVKTLLRVLKSQNTP